ncbi:MAG TPA: polysaccharide deacetylase family protein [Firmicutes bacterium]|nr:polysaccharide deacetylase family protein [Bacillota bacterium]
MYWANFIHLYQPPTQEEWIVRKVADECYRAVIRVLKENPQGKLTVNINGSLTEQFHKYGMSDILHDLGELADRGQIEFTGSAMYHPILPLIPEKEVRRQIRLNQEANRRYLGEIYQPRGFFPPEMCYSRRVAEIVKDEGFDWIIVDELSYNGRLGEVKNDRTYQVEGLDDFYIFFKERKHSAALTYGAYKDLTGLINGIGREKLKEESYLLTGTDGEIYGHHHHGLENLLREAFQSQELKTCVLSELLEFFPARENVETVAASWSTWVDELEKGIAYPQWQYPGNHLHDLQWRLTKLALQAVEGTGEDDPARWYLDQGLHSCQYWWASCRQYFNVEMISKGADKLVEAVRAKGDAVRLQEAEKLAKELKETAKEWERTGQARETIRQYQQAHPAVASELTFGGAK